MFHNHAEKLEILFYLFTFQIIREMSKAQNIWIKIISWILTMWPVHISLLVIITPTTWGEWFVHIRMKIKLRYCFNLSSYECREETDKVKQWQRELTDKNVIPSWRKQNVNSYMRRMMAYKIRRLECRSHNCFTAAQKVVCNIDWLLLLLSLYLLNYTFSTLKI